MNCRTLFDTSVRAAVIGVVLGSVLAGPLAPAGAAQAAAMAPAVPSERAVSPAQSAGDTTQAEPAERAESAAQARTTDAPASPALDALLNSLSEDTPDAKRCIRQASIDKTDILNSNIIVFKDDRKRIFINQLRVRCPDLRPGAKVVYTGRGDGQLCQLDSINVLHAGAGGLTTGPSCMLGKFEPISQDQLDVLEERYTPDGKDVIEAIFE